MAAVEQLLICDFLFRTKDLKKRKYYNEIADKVKSKGGEVVVFSTLHPSGEKLKNITGIAAILRFEVPPLETEEDS